MQSFVIVGYHFAGAGRAGRLMREAISDDATPSKSAHAPVAQFAIALHDVRGQPSAGK